MKKAKRIFALAGAVILIASFACTFIIPVVSYACILLYRLSHKDDSEK